MALTAVIANSEIAPLAPVTGDAVPASNRLGVLTRLVDGDDEIATDIGGLKTIFDAHDHNPATGTGGGGQLVGSGGVRAIAAAQVTTAKISDLAITGAKTAAGAIGTTEIADDTMTKGKLGGGAVVGPFAMGSSDTHTVTHGLGFKPLFSWWCDSWQGELIRGRHVSDNAFELIADVTVSGPIDVYAVYYPS